ncbi:MAG: hypothetical protein ACRCYY_12320 [Trueperaceae bacterium]
MSFLTKEKLEELGITEFPQKKANVIYPLDEFCARSGLLSFGICYNHAKVVGQPWHE